MKITVLESIEPVRLRPGMYIGSTDARGLLNLLLEVVGNSLDQHLVGNARRISVSHASGWTTVSDDGEGISIEWLERIFTTLHDGATLDGHHPHVHIRHFLHGVGLGPVSALSSLLKVTTHRDGHAWSATFAEGRVLEPCSRGAATDARGTTIRYRPDQSIFKDARLDESEVETRLSVIAQLAPALTLELQGRRLATSGLPGLLGPTLASSALTGHGVVDDVEVDFALAWSGGAPAVVRSFVSYAETPEGGSHVEGARRALRTSAERPELASQVSMVIHVGLLHPRFQGPMKWKLDEASAAKAVEVVVGRELAERGWVRLLTPNPQ